MKTQSCRTRRTSCVIDMDTKWNGQQVSQAMMVVNSGSSLLIVRDKHLILEVKQDSNCLSNISSENMYG